MKLLLIHADYLNYQVKEKAKFAEEVPPAKKVSGMRNPLIAFACAEKMDEKSGDVIEKTAEEIKSAAAKVKAQNIALFPFAHLSEDLASPEIAIQILKCVKCKLSDEGYRVLRVPFGWYKAFEYKCKGHPLSVQFRSIPRSKSQASSTLKLGCE